MNNIESKYPKEDREWELSPSLEDYLDWWSCYKCLEPEDVAGIVRGWKENHELKWRTMENLKKVNAKSLEELGDLVANQKIKKVEADKILSEAISHLIKTYKSKAEKHEL